MCISIRISFTLNMSEQILVDFVNYNNYNNHYSNYDDKESFDGFSQSKTDY